MVYELKKCWFLSIVVLLMDFSVHIICSQDVIFIILYGFVLLQKMIKLLGTMACHDIYVTFLPKYRQEAERMGMDQAIRGCGAGARGTVKSDGSTN